MGIKYKIWFEKNGKLVFGKGRENILKTMDELQSLNAAAKELGMSYRAAWGRLKASQDRIGMKLIDNSSQTRTMQLTPLARTIIKHFEKLEKDLNKRIYKAEQDIEKLINYEEERIPD